MIGCWQLGESLVDPGPSSCLDALLEGLDREPRRLLLTHIHLDHAGAAGSLVERFPELEVCVHEIGIRHLADPSRLLDSARRLYGDQMDELWGPVLPVPERNLRSLRGGEELSGGVVVLYAPGHASHHVAYLIDGVAYVGDVAGVRIPPAQFVLMPTPPPDIDVELWLDSIERVAAARPARLALTHFGAVDQVGRHLDAARRGLREIAALARERDQGGFVEAVVSRIVAAAGGKEGRRYEQAAPPWQLYLGLERYWAGQPATRPRPGCARW